MHKAKLQRLTMVSVYEKKAEMQEYEITLRVIEVLVLLLTIVLRLGSYHLISSYKLHLLCHINLSDHNRLYIFNRDPFSGTQVSVVIMFYTYLPLHSGCM